MHYPTQTLCGMILVLSMQITAEKNYLSNDFIASINRRATTWEATHNTFDVPIETLACARRDPNNRAGLVRRRNADDPLVDIEPSSLPAAFDARTQWPKCPSIGVIHSQGDCGTCWAMAAAAAMTDRVCIQSNGSDHFTVSAQDLVTCCVRCRDGGDVCAGGYASRAWMYWYVSGIVSGGPFGSQHNCRPYAFAPTVEPNHPGGGGGRMQVRRRSSDSRKTCDRSCQLGYARDYAEDLRYGADVYLLPTDEKAIRTEIYRRGPVQTNLVVYEDFLCYKSGVYEHVCGEETDGHAVRIIGWGVENGTKYWLVANTWGPRWGELGGVFKILRGQNHCRIEEEVYAGLPCAEGSRYCSVL